MINEDKVRIMTRCACYEKKNGKRDLPLAGFFKSDYVKYNILKTLISVIIAFVLLLGIYIMVQYEDIFNQLNQLHFKKMGFTLAGILLALLVLYYIIARMVYQRRFERARKSVTVYYRDLKHLKLFYDKEQDKSPTIFEEGGNAEQNDEFIDY